MRERLVDASLPPRNRACVRMISRFRSAPRAHTTLGRMGISCPRSGCDKHDHVSSSLRGIPSLVLIHWG